jgi:anti-anti-sigma factor
MKVISKITNQACIIKIEGAIIGIHAKELGERIFSANLANFGITKLIMDFRRVTMIDSIGIEVIKHVQGQKINVSILNSRGTVKYMLDRAKLNCGVLPFVKIICSIEHTLNEANLKKSFMSA